MRDARERLRDILEAISAIERYLDRGKAEFEQNELLQVWFVHNLQIIGEAARGLPADIRSLAPEVAWPRLSGKQLAETPSSSSSPWLSFCKASRLIPKSYSKILPTSWLGP